MSIESGPKFEQPINKKEAEDGSKDHFDLIKESIEFKIGKELPENKEEVFRNFDKLIPKEVDHIDIADKVKPEDEYSSLYRYTREGIKSTLERELYGSAIKDVENYFKSEVEATEKEFKKEKYKKNFDPKLMTRHDKCIDLFNQIGMGSLHNPLAEIEIRINDVHTNESEKDKLRKFAERLSAEIYQGRPQNEVTINDIRQQIKKEAVFNQDVKDRDVREYNTEHFGKVLKNLDKGNLVPAMEETEFKIGRLQELLEERKNKDLKKSAEPLLKEKYGDNYMSSVNKELESLRRNRKFLYEKLSKIGSE